MVLTVEGHHVWTVLDEAGRRRLDGLLEDGTRIVVAAVTQISVTDSGAGSEALGKLRELGIITESGSGLESVATPQRDIILLDQAAANEVLEKLRALGVIGDSAFGIEGEVQVLLVGAGTGVVIVLVKSAGISLSTSLPKTISLDVSRPTITLRVNPDAN